MIRVLRWAEAIETRGGDEGGGRGRRTPEQFSSGKRRRHGIRRIPCYGRILLLLTAAFSFNIVSREGDPRDSLGPTGHHGHHVYGTTTRYVELGHFDT
jgi:hypothetical protein